MTLTAEQMNRIMVDEMVGRAQRERGPAVNKFLEEFRTKGNRRAKRREAGNGLSAYQALEQTIFPMGAGLAAKLQVACMLAQRGQAALAKTSPADRGLPAIVRQPMPETKVRKYMLADSGTA
jgi:hypothetical protein